MNNTMKKIDLFEKAFVVAAVAGSLVFVGCKEKAPDAGEDAKEAVKEATDATKEATKDAGEAVEKAADTTKKAVN
jgi:Sec-independent protein translocase protein TatA